jgi:hypothetical protein
MNSPCSTTPGIRLKQPAKARRIGDPAEMGIDNPVAAIGDKNVAVLAVSDPHLPGNAALRKCRRDGALGRRQAERNHLDRPPEMAEDIDRFAVVGDHDHAIRGRRHDFFPEQRAAACRFSASMST